jgi:hypothetical protein
VSTLLACHFVFDLSRCMWWSVGSTPDVLESMDMCAHFFGGDGWFCQTKKTFLCPVTMVSSSIPFLGNTIYQVSHVHLKPISYLLELLNFMHFHGTKLVVSH